jgi:ribosomal protein S18 acetylase RimI-like enzyme
MMERRMAIAIDAARFPEDLDTVRSLFRAYVDSLGVDLGFQDVEAEFKGLPGKYAEPKGAVLLARGPEGPVGSVAMRPTDSAGACEMKRLYVSPAARGQALGRRLAEAIIDRARQAGYRQMLLDTLASMNEARALYASLGFRPVAPYYDNPLPGTAYLALDLGP